MQHKQRRQRLTARALELVGALALVAAVALWHWQVALALAGLVALIAAQFPEELL